MSEEQTENEPDVEIKEELYMLYLEIKEEITSKNISLEKDQIIEAVSSININTIIEYIREMVYILINIKIPKKEENNLIKRTKEQTQNELYQMESHIRKLENDIKFLIQKEFQNKIKRDTLEMKVNSYMEMENEFEELKEKVKYQGGEFLNNERKDNEIIILRQENGILKKEIEKHEINNKKYESKIKSEQETIQELTNQISLLNNKVSKLELLTTQKESNNQSNNANSSINININNNGNSSSKWIIKQENQDLNNNNDNINNLNNNIHSINNNINSFSNYGVKKRKINNFTKNNAKYSISNSNNNLNIGKRYTRYESGRQYMGFQNKNLKNNGMSTIDNNNAFTSTYNKILNNLCVKDIKDIESPNKKINKSKKIKKNNSISMYIEEYDKSVMENKYITNKGKKYNSTRKNNNGYNKIIGFAPNSRYPLSGKHKGIKNINSNNNNINNVHSVQKKNLQKDKNSASYSSLILKRK